MPTDNDTSTPTSAMSTSVPESEAEPGSDKPLPVTATLLGTGTSTGVPVLGCDCKVCTSDDPRDRRTRCSCYVQVGPLGIQIDTGPDFRQQALREGIRRIDAVCYTHHHFDHLVGIDDLRPFFFFNRTPMPCYVHEETASVMRSTYDYIFGSDPYPGAAAVHLHEVDDAFVITSRYDDEASVRVDPILLYHGDLPVYGYRIGDFAYLTDVSHVPEESYAKLHGLDVLILDALRPKSHPTHFSFDEALEVARRIGARETHFIHMTHNVLHADQEARLPDDVHLAYDGLTIRVGEGEER